MIMHRLLYCFFCFYISTCVAQTASQRELTFLLKAGLSWQQSGFAETGISNFYDIGSGDMKDHSASRPWAMIGPTAGCEFRLQSGRFAFVPKLGCEYYNLGRGFFARLHVADYTDLRVSDLRLVPGIGVSFIAILNISYGYALPLTPARLPGLTPHQLSCFIYYPRAFSWKRRSSSQTRSMQN
jgi:hypothetical protein